MTSSCCLIGSYRGRRNRPTRFIPRLRCLFVDLRHSRMIMEQRQQHRSLKRQRSATLSPAPQARPSKPKRQCFGTSHLLNLPQELVLRILHHLSPGSLLNLSLTSHKMHNLASDPQLWKNLFWKRFVGPQIQKEKRRLSLEANPQDTILQERRLWGDDVVLVQKEREAVAKLTASMKVQNDASDSDATLIVRHVPKVFGMDWKAKYRLRHNWRAGTCKVNKISILSMVSKQTDHELFVAKFHSGYLIVAGKAEGLRIWAVGKNTGCGPKLICKLSPSNQKDRQSRPSAISLDEFVCSDRSGQLLHDRGIDIVIGYRNGSIGIFHFSPAMETLVERCQWEKHSDGAIAMMAYAQPYLLCLNETNQLSLCSFHNSLGHTKWDKPILLKKLQAQKSRTPSCLSLRQDPVDMHIVAIAVFATYTFIYGLNIGIQELRIDSNQHTVLVSRIARSTEYYDLPVPQTHRGSIGYTMSKPTSTSYHYPHIITSHDDNTLTLYNVISTAETLHISEGYKMWGHTAGVRDVMINSKRAVSVDCRGSLRVWDLWGNMRGNKSVIVKGTGGMDLTIKSNGLVGFDEDEIVVYQKRQHQELNAPDVKDDISMTVYDFR